MVISICDFGTHFFSSMFPLANITFQSSISLSQARGMSSSSAFVIADGFSNFSRFRGATFGAKEDISVISFFIITPSLDLTDKSQRILYLSFALGILSESSVAVSLCWILHKAKTGFRRHEPDFFCFDKSISLNSCETYRTDSLIRILMVYVVNTGLIVA